MYLHHQEALDRIRPRFESDENVLGVLLAGSIGHGFARPDSDVDLLIILPDDLHAAHERDGTLTFIDRDCCSWENGYVDCKYVSPGLMERVKADGSEPARFAYAGASVVFSRIDGLEALIAQIASYPIERKEKNLRSFFAQFRTWNWFCGEAFKHENAYLLSQSIDNLILFGGRLLLAHNETLYPYHKWFLKVLDGVRERPEGLMKQIDDLLAVRDAEKVARLYESIAKFRDWPDASWSHQFMIDSELSWLTGRTSIAEI